MTIHSMIQKAMAVLLALINHLSSISKQISARNVVPIMSFPLPSINVSSNKAISFQLHTNRPAIMKPYTDAYRYFDSSKSTL